MNFTIELSLVLGLNLTWTCFGLMNVKSRFVHCFVYDFRKPYMLISPSSSVFVSTSGWRRCERVGLRASERVCVHCLWRWNVLWLLTIWELKTFSGSQDLNVFYYWTLSRPCGVEMVNVAVFRSAMADSSVIVCNDRCRSVLNVC